MDIGHNMLKFVGRYFYRFVKKYGSLVQKLPFFAASLTNISVIMGFETNLSFLRIFCGFPKARPILEMAEVID